MDPAVARRLVSQEGAEALELAQRQPDPDSLAAATSLRRTLDPDLAAAALTQTVLRRRARIKFGDTATTLFFTPDGLEQATRPDVARWRAERLRSAGVTRIVDLGCGIGADAMAMRNVGLDVVAVERDETTAILAAANLGERAQVIQADATTLDLQGRAVFCDPARRTGAGRSWNVADFSPSWDFVTELLERPEGGCLKLGPGLPHRLIPSGTLTEWISHRGDVVEAGVWSHHLAEPGRATLLLPTQDRLVADGATAPTGPITRYLHEPDPGVLAAGAAGTLAAITGAHRLHPEVAYLATEDPVSSPFWTSFEVLESLAWREKDVRRWVRDNEIGTLEIKKRGIEVDPAALRRRLKLNGPNAATIIITPTLGPAQVLRVRRLGRQP